MTADLEGRGRRLASAAFVLLFTAAFGVTLVLALASFPVGVYTAFYTVLTAGVGAGTPVPLYLWVGPVPVVLPVAAPMGVLFCAVLVVYAVLMAVAAARGPRLFGALEAGTKGDLGALLSSDLLAAFVSIGFLTFTATAIDSLTETVGGQIGALRGSDAALFLSTTTSPLLEEFGFRVCIIGAVAAILSLGGGGRAALRALWRPSSVYEDAALGTGKEFVVLVALAASSVAFGLAHVAPGSGWEAGKLPEAIFGGVVLGYVYIRYGFHVAVLTHWGVDYLGSVYSFFGEGAHGIPWASEPGYALQQWATADLVFVFGLVSFVLVGYLWVSKRVGPALEEGGGPV